MDRLERVGIETVLNIIKVEEGNLKILLFKDKENWKLPNKVLEEKESLHDCSKKTLEKFIGYSNLFLKQLSIFDELREYSDSRLVDVSYLCLTDSITEKLKFKMNESLEYKWFAINEISSLIVNHKEILIGALNILKNEVEKPNILLKLYPNSFTLPELQKMLEKLLGVNLDRRNFRKKLLGKGWIKETGKNSESGNGRPSKLYIFNKNIKDEGFF